MEPNRWKKFKSSGSFKRKVNDNYNKIVNPSIITQNSHSSTKSSEICEDGFDKTSFSLPEAESKARHVRQFLHEESGMPEELRNRPLRAEVVYECCADEDTDEDEEEYDNEDDKNEALSTALKNWSLEHNIKQSALRDFIKIINDRLPNVLPKDPRTLLQTTQDIPLTPLGQGQYWHHGLRQCLQSLFADLNESKSISINVNLDGLPIYKSSKDEFWPILFNIVELPHVEPMIIGIYSGKSKPTDLNAFLAPFVDELNEILVHGVLINSHKINVKLRCIICDSPARSFVKG